jgi:DNA-directed RNA polymerase subunit RPC12/RpoP
MGKTKTMPPNRNSSSHPPTISLVTTDHILRDLMVKLRRPRSINGLNDPYDELARNFAESSDYLPDETKTTVLKKAISTMRERGLLGYFPEQKSFQLTQKAVQVFEELYIVICSNCGASNVKPNDSDSSGFTCRNCEQKI